MEEPSELDTLKGPPNYDNCIYFNRSDESDSFQTAVNNTMELDPCDYPKVYADRNAPPRQSAFSDEEFVFDEEETIEDIEAYKDCSRVGTMFAELVKFVSNVEDYLKGNSHITKEMLQKRVGVVRNLLVTNADCFYDMADMLANKHISKGKTDVEETNSATDRSSGIFTDTSSSNSVKEIVPLREAEIDQEECSNSENSGAAATNEFKNKYSLRPPKRKRGSDESESSDGDKENLKSARKVNKTNLRVKKSVNKKIVAKFNENNLKGQPEILQKKLVNNLKDVLKQIPAEVPKKQKLENKKSIKQIPAQAPKKRKLENKKAKSFIHFRPSPRPRKVIYMAGEKLFLNPDGSLTPANSSMDVETANLNNLKLDELNLEKEDSNVNPKGSQSLPNIRQRKSLYSPDIWLLELNKKRK